MSSTATIVEVFKTNVQQQEQAKMLLTVLSQHFPMLKINFDLDDCDKILRVEGTNFSHERIIELVIAHGSQCEVLD